MAKFFPVYIHLVLLFCCKPSPHQQPGAMETSIKDSIEYINQVRLFISKVKNLEPNDTLSILTSEPVTIDDSACFNQILSDTTAGFSAEERDEIKIKATKSPISRWTGDILPNVKIVSSDTIRSIFENHSEGWDYFYRYIGRSSNSFSTPIFLRNYSYCLFYSQHSCGYLCGEGKFILFKKAGEKWIELKSYCGWVS